MPVSSQDLGDASCRKTYVLLNLDVDLMNVTRRLLPLRLRLLEALRDAV